MSEEKENVKAGTPAEDEAGIEKLLRDREKIDEMLKEKYAQYITVIFTDIKGSTTFFDTYGDIEGRLMVQKHNEMLFPVIEKQNGRVIKTIGDAIMAAFDEPVAAVQAAIGMQQVLRAYNQKKKERKDQIHIRIGVNSGEGLVEKHDIFGDVVNVAARVESLASPDEILVSSAVYAEVRKTDDIICRYAKQTKVKGKEEPVEIYRVIWQDEQIAGGLTRSGAPAGAAARRPKKLKRRLEIDIIREGNTIRVTASEKTAAAESTMRPYDEMHVSMARIEERCQEVNTLLNRANTRGKVSKDILVRLREVGQVLFDDLLSAKAKEALRSASVDDLVCNIEDSLVQIPWELLFDGEQFLCQKFNMGRIVKTKRDIINIKQRVMSRPLKMLIVSDPRGDLANACKEGQMIREQLDSNASFISANQRSGAITSSYITEKIRNFDIIHYAGHADYDSDDPSHSGWLLEGGKLTSADVMKLVGGKPMPALVFCNACQSGQTEEWKLGASYSQEIFGLANAFLLAGVQHYIGTFWEILDEPGARFAEAFYRAMLEGSSIGEAMRLARIALIKEYGEDTIVWASYMLYGDPGVNYLGFAEDLQPDDEEPPAYQQPQEAAQLRSASAETGPFEAGAPARRKTTVLAVVVLGIVLIAGFIFFQQKNATGPQGDSYTTAFSLLHANQIEQARQAFESLDPDDPRRFEGLAAVYYELGDYDKTLEMSAKALETAPPETYAHVVKGHVLLLQGKPDAALKEYEQAAGQEIKWQRAEALNGIARIYSSRGETEKSVEYYARAAELNPQSAEILTNQAFAMQRMGDSSGAVSAFQKAASINPADPITAALLVQAQKQQQAAADAARQERIDRLVTELAETFKAGGMPPAPADEWTSRPLTISLLNFTGKGAPAVREGEEEFFMLKLSTLLQESGRIQIVEREILDKLLSELKLSSTGLVDPNMAVRVGRILAARIIATGSIMRYKGDVQVSVRLTDTETTALKGSLAEAGSSLDSLAETAAQKIVAKLEKAYPLRGTVFSLEGEQILLNIGTGTGVQSGMAFKVFEELTGPQAVKPRFRQVATITIASVEQDVAYGTIQEQSQGLQPQMKVEQITR